MTAGIIALVDSANKGVPSVKELTEAARGLDDAIAESGQSYEETMASTVAAANMANRYIDKLEELGSVSNRSAEQQKEYEATLSLLCQTVPELSSLINQETGEIEGGTAALREHTAAWEADAKAQARQKYLAEIQQQYNDILLEQATNEVKLTETKIKAEAVEKNRAAAQERMNEIWDETAAPRSSAAGHTRLRPR